MIIDRAGIKNNVVGTSRRVLAVILLSMLAACSSVPPRNPVLEDARSAYDAARNDPQVASLAPVELNSAAQSFGRAESVWSGGADQDAVNHLAYLARQRAAIAQETARLKAAEASVTTVTNERDRVRLEARERETEVAQRAALAARQNAEQSQLAAELSRRQAEESRSQALAAQQQASASQQQATQSQQQATQSQQQMQDAQARVQQLEAQLNELNAKPTDRGMVVTLGDLLFDVGKANLKSGGLRTLQRLADFMRQYPQRRVSIEGFTDSTGSDQLNIDLSERRANSVRLALIDMGLAPERMSAHGYGKAFPVVSNDNAAGRQLNRRVEIVISDESGNVRPR